MLDKEKSAGILGGLRAFLTQYNANLRLFSGNTSLWSVAQPLPYCLNVSCDLHQKTDDCLHILDRDILKSAVEVLAAGTQIGTRQTLIGQAGDWKRHTV